MSSPADSNQDQIVQSAVPSSQDDTSENPAPLNLSMNAPSSTAETAVRSVRFSDDVLTMPRIVFLEPTGWFLFFLIFQNHFWFLISDF